MLRFRCPHCQGKYKVPNRKRGSLIQCPHCDRNLSVPYEGSSYEIPYSDHAPDDDNQWPFPDDQSEDSPQISEETLDDSNQQPPQQKNAGTSDSANAKTSGLAITSLILGLLTIPAILGLILGIIARKKIRQNPQQLKGQGLALAGIIISTLTLIGSIITIVLITMVASTVIEKVEQAVEQATQQAAEQIEQDADQSGEQNAGDQPDELLQDDATNIEQSPGN